MEKSHFARAMRQTEELQGDLTSPRISEDLLVSECCPATSANPRGKPAGKYGNSRGRMEVPHGSMGSKEGGTRESNCKPVAGEESRYEPSLPGASTSVG